MKQPMDFNELPAIPEEARAGEPLAASCLFGEHSPDCDVNDGNPDGISKPCNCGQTTRNFFEGLAEVCSHVTNAGEAEHQALRAHAAKCAEETLSPNARTQPPPG
jgi:hypothetical protein